MRISSRIYSASLLSLTFLAGAAVAQSVNAGQPEIIPHKINPQGAGAPTAGSTAEQTPPIVYNGGPLIASPTNIYYIWYGNWNQTNGSDNGGGQQILRDFATSIGGSPYFQINNTYSKGSYSITGAVTFGGIAGTGESTDNYSQGTHLHDSSILTIVNNALNSGALPYDPAGVYFVLTSSDVAETSGFCTRYCGWHTSGTASLGHVRYSFVGNANRCLNACAAQTTGPNGNAGVDGMASVIAHELEEATTDPDPRSGWADSGGSENADKCAWTFGGNLGQVSGAYYNMTLGSRKFLIQRNLSAADNKCYVDNTGKQ